MNSYERIYNILTESTPIGREGSKKIGQKAAKDIAKHKPAPDDIRADAEKEGYEAVASDPITKATKELNRIHAIRARLKHKYRSTVGQGPNPASPAATPAGNPLTPGGQRIYRTEAGVKTYRRNPSKTSVYEPFPDVAAKKGVKPGSYWDK